LFKNKFIIFFGKIFNTKNVKKTILPYNVLRIAIIFALAFVTLARKKVVNASAKFAVYMFYCLFVVLILVNVILSHYGNTLINSVRRKSTSLYLTICTYLRFFIYLIISLPIFYYFIFNMVFKNDFSFQNTHILLFYFVMLLTIIFLSELRIKYPSSFNSLMLFFLYFIIFTVLWSQSSYITAKFVVTFPEVHRGWTKFKGCPTVPTLDANGEVDLAWLHNNTNTILSKIGRFGDSVEGWLKKLFRW
jgi:hypothetical protein